VTLGCCRPGVRVEKALSADLIEAAARQMEPDVARAFLAAVENMRAAADLQALEQALAGGNIEQILAAAGVRPGAPGFGALAASLAQGFAAAGSQIMAAAAPRLEARFDALNPNAVTYLQGARYQLIREVTAEQRVAVGQIIRPLFETGMPPAEMARSVRDVVGLTARQAQAVLNFRRYLETSHIPPEARDGLWWTQGEALDRQLRDGRFDRTVAAAIKTGKPIPPEKVTAMVDAYRRRYLAYRATMIARTESIRTANAAALESYRQLAESGVFDGATLRRYWVVARDERTCKRCRAIPGLNPKGVGLQQPFKTLSGPLLHAPEHPSCRCTFVVRETE
jgi:hypothetical protein